MKKIVKIIVPILLVLLLVFIAGDFTNSDTVNGIDKTIGKIENTLNANSYTVKWNTNMRIYNKQKETYEVLNEKNNQYFALKDTTKIDGKYLTRYDGLALNGASILGISDMTSVDIINKINLSNLLGTSAVVANNTESIHSSINYNAIELLGNTYKEENDEFNFVKTYQYSNDGLVLGLYYEEYMEWCYDHFEEVSKIHLNDYELGLELFYYIEFNGKYIKSITQLLTSGNAYADRYYEKWTFTKVNKTNEDLKAYVKDPDAYIEQVEEEIKSETIDRITLEIEENPHYRYTKKGKLKYKDEEIEYIGNFTNTYTGEEIITHLKTGEKLPDNEKHWKILYINYIKEFLYTGYNDGRFDLYDRNEDGIPELIYIRDDYWVTFCTIQNGEVQEYFGDYNMSITDDYIFYNASGGDELRRVIYWIDSKTGDAKGYNLLYRWIYDETAFSEEDYYGGYEYFKEEFVYKNGEYTVTSEVKSTESEFNDAFSSLRNQKKEYVVGSGTYSENEYWKTLLNFK